MLTTALLSILSAIWAFQETVAMAEALILNALFCFVMALKIEKKVEIFVRHYILKNSYYFTKGGLVSLMN